MIEEVGDLQTEVDTASGSVGEVGIAEVVVLILVADTSGHGVLPFGTALPLLSDTEGGVEDLAQLYVEVLRTVCADLSENGRRQGVTAPIKLNYKLLGHNSPFIISEHRCEIIIIFQYYKTR